MHTSLYTFLTLRKTLILLLFVFVWSCITFMFLFSRPKSWSGKPNTPQETVIQQALQDGASSIQNEENIHAFSDPATRAHRLRIQQLAMEMKRRPYHIDRHNSTRHIVVRSSKNLHFVSFKKYCAISQRIIVDKEEPFTFDHRNPDFQNTPIHKDRPVYRYMLDSVSIAVHRPMVSVVVPFYNTEHVFYGTISSILKQSLQQFEIIIVNDDSTSPISKQILNEFRNGRYDPRIRVVDHNENGGPGASRNTGYKAAKGDFIYFLDSDDLIEPTTLEKLYWHLLTSPQFAFTKGHSIGHGAFNYLWPYGFELREKFLKENSVTVSAMFPKKFLERMNGFDVELRKGLEDWNFWLKSAENGYWGSTIPEYMDWYLRKTKDQTKITWNDWDKTADDLRFKEKYPKIYSGQFPNPQRKLNSFSVSLNIPQFAENRLKKVKPRIMIIIPWCVLGGADRFNLNLIRQLYFRDWEVTVITTLASDNRWGPDFMKWTSDIFFLPVFLEMNDFPRFILYLIKSRRPDVVMVSNSEFGYQILPMLRSLAPEPAYIDYNHMEQEDWKNGGYPRYGVGSSDMLDLNIVASNFLKDWMVKRGVDPRKIRVCYVNVDTNEFKRDVYDRAEVRSRYGIPQDAVVIMYAARFVDQKQPKVMANVFKQLRDKGYNFYALVAGDGTDKQWVDEFVNTNRLQDRVKLLGGLNSNQIHPIMSASDIMFLPSEWEGIALAIYEGMSMGLAIVGADVGGQKELFKGKNPEDFGFLVPKFNDPKKTIEKYVSVFEKLLNDKNGLIERLGQNARKQIVEHFDMDLMGDCMIEQMCYARQMKERRVMHKMSERTAEEIANRGVEFLKMQEGK